MLEFLKKIGLPGIIAALVSAIVTMIPILFQLDDRYAKAEDIDRRLETVSKQVQDLSIEMGKLAGTQEVLVSVLSKSETRIVHAEPPAKSIESPTVEPSLPTAKLKMAPKPESTNSIQLNEVSRQLKATQQKIEQIQSY